MALRKRQSEVLAELGIPRWHSREPASADRRPESTRVASSDSSGANASLPALDALPGRPASTPADPGMTRVDPKVPPTAECSWPMLAERVAACSRCPELVRDRHRTVFGSGDRNADWMFIGEAPGAEEDRLGEPFVGRAGQLLDRMLAALGLDREHNVYIANVIKCRPPGNRDPLPEERDACREYLDRQIRLVHPRVIVALGRVAAQALLQTDAPLGRLRGREHSLAGIPVVVTYHPAYLLRFPAEKAKTWEDLCRARRLPGVAEGSGPDSVP